MKKYSSNSYSKTIPDHGFACNDLIIDGYFNDWQRIRPLLVDSLDAPNSPVDIESLFVCNDQKNIFFKLCLKEPATLPQLDGTLSLLLDTDGNEKTGGVYGNFRGVDFIIDNSPPRIFNEHIFYIGTAARVVLGEKKSVNIEKTVNIYNADFVQAPTCATSLFEISIKRNIKFSNGEKIAIKEEIRGKLVFTNQQGHVQDETDIFNYHCAPSSYPVDGQFRDPIAVDAATNFRVVSWNVADQAILTKPEGFRQILTALNPDVIMLDEVSSECNKIDIETILPDLSDEKSWNIIIGKGGGYQHGVIASRLPIELVKEFEFLEFPQHLIDKHIEKIKSSPKLSIEKYSLSNGVATVGAKVEIGNQRILFVTVDLQSRGRCDSPEEAKRLLEAQTIREAAMRTFQQNNLDAVVIAGDLNLVGSDLPLDEMRNWGNVLPGPLALCQPLQLDGKSNFTWYNSRELFAPGRLDFMLYKDSSIKPVKTFVFNSYKLEEQWLENYKLQKDVSSRTSDHLPIVTDFKGLK